MRIWTLYVHFLYLRPQLDYSNSKSKIGTTENQHDKTDAYHEVWSVMAKVQRGQRD